MKDIQKIIKEVANRYDVEYNENSSAPKVQYKDGTIRSLDISEIKRLFPKSVMSDDNWRQISNFHSNQVKEIRMRSQDSNNEYSAKELSAMTY